MRTRSDVSLRFKQSVRLPAGLNKILPQVAQLARIPEHQRGLFCIDLQQAVEQVWDLGRPLHHPGSAALTKTVRKLRAAANALQRLNKKDRDLAEEAFESLRVADYDVEEIHAPILSECSGWSTVGAMADMLQWAAVGGPAPDLARYVPGRRPRRPRGTVGNPAFRSFVWALNDAIRRRGGKRLSYTDKTNTGDLVRALKLLKTCLPNSFKLPSPATIQRHRKK